MQDRFDRIDDKLNSLQKDINVVIMMTNERVTKLETTQKGVIALCVAIITASLTALAKTLHLA